MKHKFKFLTLLLLFALSFGFSSQAWAAKFVSDGTTRLYVQNMKPSGWQDDYWTGNNKGWIQVSNTSNFGNKAGTISVGCVYTGSDGVYYVVVPQGEWQYFRVYRGESVSKDSWWNNTDVKTFDGDKNFMFSWDAGSSASFTNAMYDATFYFDNSSTNWTGTSQLWVGRNNHISCNALTSIANTKLLRKKDMYYANYTKYVFCNVNYNSWSGDIESAWNNLTAGKTDLRSDRVTGVIFISGGTTTTKTSLSSYSDLNKTQTVKVMVKAAGGSYTEVDFSDKPCTAIKAKRYKLNNADASSADETDANLTGATFTSVITSAAKIYVPTPSAGYTFKGWGTSSTATPSGASAAKEYTVSDDTETYLFFTENTYSITFDANGGSSTMSDQTGLGCATAQTIQANSFTAPTGHHFIGWSKTKDGDVVYEDKGTVEALTVTTQGGTLELYAQWEPNTHTLSWNWDGGSTTDENYTKAGTVAYGTEIVYPTDASMSYAGHNFTGWSPASPQTMPDADLTITAQWEVAATATVTYDGNGNTGGTVPSDTKTYAPNEEVTVLTGTPEKNGYDFAGWKNSVNEQTYYAGQTFNITSNTTLTAQWNVHTYNITYNGLEGATHTNPENYTIESETITLSNPSNRVGYDFTGWTCGGKTITQILQGSTGDKTITATWTAQTYTITYKDQNNANFTGSWPSPDTHPITHTYDTETQLVNPTRVGYDFSGWFGNIECTGDAMTSVQATAYTANFTLYAKWTAKTYTVSFSQEGGTGGQTGTVTATYDQPMQGTVTCPTRVGYKFNGYWSATSGGTQYYTANGTATANTWNIDQVDPTLYAQWTQLNVYIQGRFSVATNHDRNTWLHTGDGTSGWNESSTNIKMQWDGTNNRYYLNTWATLKELSDKHTDFQFFNFKQCEGPSISSATEYNYGHEMPAAGEHVTMTKGGTSARAHFNVQEQNGYVILYFNEAEMWYEIQPFEGGLFDVEFSNGGGGGTVTPSGTKKTGEVSWEVTVNPNEGYSFAGWTLTGGAKADETDEELKTYYTIHVTATGDGKAIANFKIKPKIYFQTCDHWGEKVYVYFYKGNYWNDTYGAGSQKSGNCISDAIEMKYTGGNSIHYAYYDVESLRKDGMDSHIAFTSGPQTDKQYFYETNVVWLGNFSPCDNPLFVAEGFDYEKNKCGYYKGHWSTMVGDEPEDYLMMQSENWKPNENMRFKKDNNGNWTVIKTYAGSGDAYKDQFRVWRNCDGNWYGYGQSSDGEKKITSDTRNAKIYAGDHNVEIIPWMAGEYEFTWNPNAQEISVIYLGDITVANFPGEVSTFVNRQHKVKPDVTLRNGTSVTEVTITVNGNALPWSSSYATYEQNGTNLVITGNAIGTDDNLTVRYQNNKQEPYIVDRTLKVNVATPIVIQATLEGKPATGDDDYWSKTGLVHIHFWGTDATKTQDMDMSYNKDTKVFSVTAPMIDGFEFMFWYGEDINQSASEQWRKTQDIKNCTTNTCYSISYGTDKDTKRTATPKTGLCSANEYYVEITMKNGNTYKSNTIDNLDKEVSFFAPKDGVTDYTGGTVRIVHNGGVSDPITTGFDSAYVYVATINSDANGFATLSAYKGNYYIRTDGAGGMWNDYKTNDDNVMIEFTKRPNKNETYSYYWVKNVAKTGPTSGDKTNVKADVANEINDNLAGMIENDKFTDGGGYVYNSANGANIRFSYEPTTNEFKRAIIGGSSDNNFLNVYSTDGHLYADDAKVKQLDANAELTESKFNDVSDWVYEKVVYVDADGTHPSTVILKSVYNGQTSHLLGYNKNAKGEDTDEPKPLEVMGKNTNGLYALRITYDYKKNRLMASWEPGNKEISTDEVVDADVLFIQKEYGTSGSIDNMDVAQITYSETGKTKNAKLTSLKNMMYILEVTSNTIPNTSFDNQLYWICLPFDVKISDVFGVEGYVTLDGNGNATAGTWGIQRYDGATRAAHGWFKEDNPEGFWKWMRRNETMHAGEGYVVVFDKTNAASWPSIGVEEPCEEGDGCVDGKKKVDKRIKRLYFPSVGTSFEISYSGGSSSVTYTDNPCNIEKRREYDGNWKVIGPVSYNNIGVQSGLTFYYDYVQSNAQGNRYFSQTVTEETVLKAFHGYMAQFGGTLTWKPFTKSDDVTGKAPLYAVAESEFKGGILTIELNNAQGTQLDRTFVNLHKNGTLGFDQNMELTKIEENCAQIASVNEDVLYAGSTLPLDIELVPLNVKVVANGTYDIALAQSLEGLEVRLYDAFEQTTTPLDLMSATVTLNKGEYKDRFYLQLKQKSGETPTSFEGKIEQFNLPTDKTQKLLINGNIYLINGGRVYNATGAELR